ncbi:MAG TPA: MFS transporter [Bryobacteraceae bacterium]|nr:MFS transporter [Bryobacteraceae bacterium]
MSVSAERSLFADWRHSLSFWVGSLMVAIGVGLHVPMFLMGRNIHYRLAGMPMGTPMLIGMFLIILGVGAAAWGLLPGEQPNPIEYGSILCPEDAPLTRYHWMQILLVGIALVIDVMKAASLGFVTPGMRVEYGLNGPQIAVLPLVALMGTTVGSFIWGALADIYGRRASILLAAVMFVGTSICGCMPSFSWNVFMCFMMGLAAGGMLPVANALLAEIMPTKHRGWCLVLLGGIGTIGGYYATSELSALLQPTFGWRIMWLLGFPTGLMLIGLSPLLPESARFLLEKGRFDEARETLSRYGAVITSDRREPPGRAGDVARNRDGAGQGKPKGRMGLVIALTLTALAWGFVNFGVLLWLPGSLVAEGKSVSLASALIAKSALIAVPTVIVTTWLYSLWSTRWVLILAIGITTLGLFATLFRHNIPLLANPLISVSLLVVGTGAVISILMPYAAENFPVRNRGRATGWVAGCSKVGGVIAQTFAVFALIPAFRLAAGAVAIPTAVSLLLVWVFGRETRGTDLRELEVSVGQR